MTTTLPRLASLITAVLFLHVCGLSQDTVQLDFVCSDGQFGQTVCVDVEVENIVDIASLDFTITWDPSVLDFIDIQNAAMDGNTWYNQIGPNALKIVWIGFPDVLNIPDGGLLFQLCFQVISLGSSSSEVGLDADQLIEISNGPGETLPVSFTPCTVNVIPPTDVAAFLTSCGALGEVRPCGEFPQDGDGSFTITIAGGIPPYDYTWVNTMNGAINGAGTVLNDGGMDSQSVPPGTYEVTVTDGAGNTAMYTVVVDEQAPSFCIQTNDPACFNFTNGRIIIEATDGTAPYSILWEDVTNSANSGSAFILSSGGSAQINSRPAGEYHITLTDDHGCSTIDTVFLEADPFVIDASVTNSTCLGSEDGSVSINISGANPLPGGVYEVQFSWMAGMVQTNQVNTPPTLDPGDYAITISDAVNNCDTVFTFTVGSNTEITANFDISTPSCPGNADGEAIVTALTNGVNNGTYEFTLYDTLGNQLNAPVPDVSQVTYDMLTSGVYSVVVKEGPCRSDTIDFIITEPEPLSVSVVEVVPTGCIAGQASGEIVVEANGGTVAPGSDYTYSWNGGTLTGSTITDLPGGNYFLTVTDDNGCSETTTVNVGQATGPQIDEITMSEIGCDGDSVVTLEVIFTEGSSPVNTILWSTGGTSAIVDVVAPDTVTVTIRDSFFCFDMESIIVPGVPFIVIDSVVLEEPTCGGDTDGQITVHPSQGVEPYTYIWSTGDTSTNNLLPGLGAGNYSVTIIDADTCSIIDTTVMLNDPVPLGFSFSGIESTTCSDACDGEATLMPTGGMPGVPYDIIWGNAQRDTAFQSTATGLCGGFAHVIISQDALCFYEDSVMIPAPAPLTADTAGFSNVSCFGDNDGFISISASGGTGNKSFAWSNSGMGPIQNNLGAGLYIVTITDANSCERIDSFTITEPDTLIASIDSSGLTPVSCNSPNSGMITVSATGGRPGYEYTWSPDVSVSSVANAIGTGEYFITVTDLAGCTDSVSVTLEGAEAVEGFIPQIAQPSCFGGETFFSVDSVTGGVGGYTYALNNGQSFPIDSTITLTAGIYQVTFRDSSGCADTMQVFIDNPDPIDLTVMPEDPVVELGDSVLLEILTNGVQGSVDSIVWASEGQGILSCNDCLTPYASNVVPTIYTITVTDSAGCTASLDVFVDVNNNRQVFIPNVFTPNFDGRNDNFVIHLGAGITGVPSMRVFDRWGELMTEKPSTPTIGFETLEVWDGMFGGDVMQPGVYVYMIEVSFVDGQTLVYRGDVTLLR